jgi:hypothetical protein
VTATERIIVNGRAVAVACLALLCPGLGAEDHPAHAMPVMPDGPSGNGSGAEHGSASDRHHTLFGRVENVENDELFPDRAHPLHDRRFRITKLQAGYAYRLRFGSVNLALGGTIAGFLKPDALNPFYGDTPAGRCCSLASAWGIEDARSEHPRDGGCGFLAGCSHGCEGAVT